MPHTKSAKKHLRQSASRREHNKSVKREIKKQTRKVLEALQANQPDQAKSEFAKVSRKLDRAGAKNILHPNTAARRKSRLARLIQAKAAAPAPAAPAHP